MTDQPEHDPPLAPPPTDPLVRSVPPSPYARVPTEVARRVETALPRPEQLDPDIAMWPEVVVSIWPFAGSPTTGVWPTGWLGIDNTATVWVCTAGGEPGTWAKVGSGGGGGWPTVNGTGAGNLNAATAPTDTVGYQLQDQGSGGITIAAEGTGVATFGSVSGGTQILSTAGGVQIGAAAELHIGAIDTGFILIDTSGGAATTGIRLNTQATDTGGIGITNNGVGTGVDLKLTNTGAGSFIILEDNGGAGIQIASVTGGLIALGTTGVLQLAGATVGLYGATAVAQPAAITSPTGGTTIDTEARTAIDAILAVIGAAAGGIGITA